MSQVHVSEAQDKDLVPMTSTSSTQTPPPVTTATASTATASTASTSTAQQKQQSVEAANRNNPTNSSSSSCDQSAIKDEPSKAKLPSNPAARQGSLPSRARLQPPRSPSSSSSSLLQPKQLPTTRDWSPRLLSPRRTHSLALPLTSQLTSPTLSAKSHTHSSSRTHDHKHGHGQSAAPLVETESRQPHDLSTAGSLHGLPPSLPHPPTTPSTTPRKPIISKHVIHPTKSDDNVDGSMPIPSLRRAASNTVGGGIPGTPTASSSFHADGGDAAASTQQSAAHDGIDSASHPSNVALHRILECDLPLPQPRPPEKCPLLCCFYAEFDIKVGPKMCFQSPAGFMEQDISINSQRIHTMLSQTFDGYKHQMVSSSDDDDEDDDIESTASVGLDGSSVTTNTDSFLTNSSKPDSNGNLHGLGLQQSSQGKFRDARQQQQQRTTNGTSSSSTTNGTKRNGNHHDAENIHINTSTTTTNNNKTTVNGSSTATNETVPLHLQQQQQQQPDEVEHQDHPTIFESTSQYIIVTGSELAGHIMSLSTHAMHILTRPTMISDESYTRNALLFCVGFVLRRAADPRPYRPLLKQLALTWQSMEEEAGFLSKPELRSGIQASLDRILISLNSTRWECNFVATPSSTINLKVYRPPKSETVAISDHAVPILLGENLHIELYHWDLAIQWVIQHIDGMRNAIQISKIGEVDLQIVRACLGVLKYHDIIELVDIFMYTNRYEFTERATSLIAGNEPKLLQKAADYVLKDRSNRTAFPVQSVTSNPIRPILPTGIRGGNLSPGTSPLASPSQVATSTSFPSRRVNFGGAGFNNIVGRATPTARPRSLDKGRPVALASPTKHAASKYKPAIAELYAACTRDASFGDMWIQLTKEVATADSKEHRPNSSNRSLMQRASTNLPYPLSPGTFSDSGDHGGNLYYPQDTSERMAGSASPSKTSTHLDQLNAMQPKEPSKWNWDEVFENIDHKRFTSFGLIHGLIRRVHNFPVAMRDSPASPLSAAFLHQSSSVEDFPTTTSLTRRLSMDTSKEMRRSRAKELAGRVASKMDGSRCDDELVSDFESPLEDLIKLVESHGWTVASMYVATDSPK